jgi:hypothetical protein
MDRNRIMSHDGNDLTIEKGIFERCQCTIYIRETLLTFLYKMIE